MEQEYFSWEDYDIMDTLCIQYYNCILNKDIFNFKSGTKIDCIFVNYDSGNIGFFINGEMIKSFKLSLNINE